MNLFNSNPRNPLSEVSTEVAGGTTAKGKREKGKSKTTTNVERANPTVDFSPGVEFFGVCQ